MWSWPHLPGTLPQKGTNWIPLLADRSTAPFRPQPRRSASKLPDPSCSGPYGLFFRLRLDGKDGGKATSPAVTFLRCGARGHGRAVCKTAPNPLISGPHRLGWFAEDACPLSILGQIVDLGVPRSSRGVAQRNFQPNSPVDPALTRAARPAPQGSRRASDRDSKLYRDTAQLLLQIRAPLLNRKPHHRAPLTPGALQTKHAIVPAEDFTCAA